MHEKNRILVIDDDPSLPGLIRAVLGDSHQVLHAADGQGGLATAADECPAAILLDIGMSGMSGYEVCMKLKADHATRDIPVIFLSGHLDLDDRLAAYEAGAEDFLGKPFDPEELLDKVAVAERYAAERRRLAADAQSAFATAMTAMSSAGEMGAVLHFLRHSFTCPDYLRLADAILDTAAAYGLTASVQVRGRGGALSRNPRGNSSPIEAGILHNLSTCGRIVSMGRRTAINYDHVTLMIVDMPVDDGDRAGRLRDNLALLAEAADARVRALDNEFAVREQRRALQGLLERTRTSLNAIDARHRQQKASALEIMDALLVEMAASTYRLGLSEGQETAMAEILRSATQRVFDLLDQGLDIDQHLQAVNRELGAAADGPLT
jgi:DNA-binding response OmpR family regulator